MIIDAGYNPKDPAIINMEHLMEFIQKVFPQMYRDAGSPEFTIAETDALGKNVLGKTFGRYSWKEVTDEYVKLKNISIIITKRVFESYFKLGGTVGHELIHGIDHFKGNYLKWYNKYGENTANDFTELNAHEWQFSVYDFNDSGYDKINTSRYNSIYLRIHGID